MEILNLTVVQCLELFPNLSGKKNVLQIRPDRIDLALRLWVIETTDKLIITDTGIGDYHGEKFNQQFDIRIQEKPLEGLLKRIGKTPDEVTDLVISHLHFDHVGGILKIEGNERLPVFENATLHIHQKHYEYSLSPTDRDSGVFIQMNMNKLLSTTKKEIKFTSLIKKKESLYLKLV